MPRFDPLQLSGLVAWYKADAIAGLADGAAISTWPDWSGTGNDLTQSGTARPLFKVNIVNGKPVARFDGSNDWMSKADNATLDLAGPVTIFAVVKNTIASGEVVLSKDVGGVDNYGLGHQAGLLQARYDDGVKTGGSPSEGVFQLWMLQQSAGATLYGVNGVIASGVGGTITANAALLSVGASTEGVGNFFNGDIAEILLFNRALTEDERRRVERYLEAKYNLGFDVPGYAGPALWGATITLWTGAVHRFAEDDITVGGNAYKGYLRLSAPVELRRSLASDTGEIELVNTDLYLSGLIAAAEFEGAQVDLELLYVGVDRKEIILRGRLGEQEEREDAVAFRITSELDPGQIDAPERLFTAACPWDFGASGVKVPLNAGPCGYRADASAMTQPLAERTATAVGNDFIEDSTLAMTVDEHKDRSVLITSATTGRAQLATIRSNTATRLNLYQRWPIVPTGTVKFKVFTFTNGAPRIILTSTSAFVDGQAASGAARTLTDTGLAMATDEHKDSWLVLTSGTGSGQIRKIGSNTDNVFTIDAAEADFSPAPDSTTVYRIAHRTCPKDITASCEQRARTFEFGGIPVASIATFHQFNRGD